MIIYLDYSMKIKNSNLEKLFLVCKVHFLLHENYLY
ncbi:MAG: hypothetical protein QG575_446 [Euryarchaeota archaeon]|nr:hypothetical protein [Euryarchaeota archaeon]